MTRQACIRTIATLTVLLLSSCGGTPASETPATPKEAAQGLPIPADLQDQIDRSLAIGRQLYLLDKAAAIGTDVLLANVPNALNAGLAGYIPLQEGDEGGQPKDSFLVTFFTAETPPRLAYEIRVAVEAAPTFRAFDPPLEAPPPFAALIRARQTAIAALPATNQPINPVLLPGEVIGERGVLAYLLAGTKEPDVAVFGRHFRALVLPDGDAISSMEPLSNAALEVPTRAPDGAVTKALVVTHNVTDYPLETHVFTSLLVKMPVYVGTRRGVWRVNGDQVTFLGDEAPNESR